MRIATTAAHPDRAHSFARAIGCEAKTDRLDAQALDEKSLRLYSVSPD